MNREGMEVLERPRKRVEQETKSVLAEWYACLGISGKLLSFGAICGLIAAFLPLTRLDGESTRTIQDWRGVLGFFVYFVVAAFAFMLYLPGGHPQERNLSYAALAAGVLLLLLGSSLLLDGIKTGRVAVVLNMTAAVAVAVGAIAKARQTKAI